MKKSFFLCLCCLMFLVSCSLLEKEIPEPVISADEENTPTPSVTPTSQENLKTINSADLPKIPEFVSGYIEVLPIKLPCLKTQIEESYGIPHCDSYNYKRMEPTYAGFLKSIMEKNAQKIVEYGTILGELNYGFSETKYRLFGDSFIGLTVLDEGQSWGSVMFTTYTVRNNTIVFQFFTNNDADHRDWENAILSNFQLKSLDDVWMIPALSTQYNEIRAFSKQYWYDRFMKMEIQ